MSWHTPRIIQPPSLRLNLLYQKTGYMIRSDEGLTLETSAFESLYGGQFTLSTQVIKPNYHT